MPPDTSSAEPRFNPPDRSNLIHDFVEHWGLMARSWGINATMGELFALLYISGTEWTADELREELRISRGNASMNLRELMTWGVVHRLHHQGDRRDYYRAEADVWTLFRRILVERKRRELDPTLDLLEVTAARWRDRPSDGAGDAPGQRVLALLDFFRGIDNLASIMTHVDPHELKELLALLPARHASAQAEGPSQD